MPEAKFSLKYREIIVAVKGAAPETLLPIQAEGS